ncbi:MAG: zinc ribbon domain-containing protein [Pyrinomonadaceae bacterium]|nr:zinc ribbon domain-containing protein [Pyrinomonadaceae bacterium]
MAEVVLKKEVCSKCGVDVRENTLFCYNCGNQVAKEPNDEAVSNGDGSVTAKAVTKAADEKKRSRAAEERRKARVSQRRSNEYVWEPGGDFRLTFLIAVLITVAVAAAVFLTVYWK